MSISIEHFNQNESHGLEFRRWHDLIREAGDVYTIAQNPSLVCILNKTFSWEGGNCIFSQQGRAVGVFSYMMLRGKIVSMPHFSYGGLICSQSVERSTLYEAAFSRLNSSEYEIRSFQRVSSNISEDKVTYLLSLCGDKDHHFYLFPGKVRTQIRKAVKNKLYTKVGGLDLLRDFYEVYSRNMRRLGSPPLSREFFKNILGMYRFGEANIFCVYLDGKVIGASMTLSYLQFNECCWVSTISKYNKYAANMLLYWKMIKYSISKKYKTFSFGRSTSGSSHAKFKKQWGGEKKQIYFNYSSRKNINIKNMKILSKIWARLPLRLCNLLGPPISARIY